MQATASTSPTSATSVIPNRRTAVSSSAISAIVFARHGRSVAVGLFPGYRGGNDWSRRAAIVRTSDDAAAIVTVEARRPKIVSCRLSRPPSDWVPSGIQNCVLASHPRGPVNVGGATPITSYRWLEIVTTVPTTRGSDAKARRQSASPSITTRAAPSSSAG